MNQIALTFLIVFNYAFISAQSLKTDSLNNSIIEFQKGLNKEYMDSTTSPLTKEDRAKFFGHLFFPPNLKFCVNAEFYRTPKEKTFKMKTTTTREPEYIKYGYIVFKIDGVAYKLNVYQSVDLLKKEQYKDYLFLPFKDLSNDKTTYAGGRFLDLRIPKGKKMIVDFNKAYNPYCAYNHKYSCPVPPPENFLNIDVQAGIMMKNDEHEH